MAKKYNNLIGQVVDWDNLMRAHLLARRGKRNRAEVMQFESRLWEELGALQMEMLWGTYDIGRYRSFIVYEPKRREILAAPYRDRVAQHAVCNVCGPIWDRAMIFDTYACRPGKGTHAGADRVQAWLRSLCSNGQVWVLKMDVSKYFFSIPHWLVKKIFRAKISCKSTLLILDRIVDSTADPTDPSPVGIPVGLLTSQYAANLVGNLVDQWAKRHLRLRHYIRYMDDMVVLLRTKEEALWTREKFQEKLATLGLRFSKTSVLPSMRGVNFLGYRIWPHKRLLRRDSVRRMRRRVKEMCWKYERGLISLGNISQRVASWVGHAGHANTENLRRDILGKLILRPPGKS